MHSDVNFLLLAHVALFCRVTRNMECDQRNYSGLLIFWLWLMLENNLGLDDWCTWKCRPDEKELLREFFAKYAKTCIDFVLEGLEDDVITKPLMQTIPLTNLNMATQLCKMLQVILTDELEIKNPQVGGWVVGLGLGIHEQIHKIIYLFKDLFF